MSYCKLLFCIANISIASCSLTYSQVNSDEDMISYMKESNALAGNETSEDSTPYSLFKELVRDGMLEEEGIIVSYMTLVKTNNRARKGRVYDFVIEKWVVGDNKSLADIHKTISGVIYDTYYEKPPKVVLVKKNYIYVIATWGAVYRNDLYEIRKNLVQKYSMETL